MSIDSVKGMHLRSTTPSQQDRLTQIRVEFSIMTKDVKSIFTIDELQELLSLKSGRSFNISLLQIIFEQASIPITDTITTDAFISNYYTIETEMKSKIDVLKKQIKDKSIKLTNTKRQCIEAKANKIPEDNNVLTIVVKKTEVKSQKYLIVRVICDDWEVTSNPTLGSPAIWEETFIFNPLSHRNIIIELWESEKTQLVTCLGKAEIPLAPLKDEEQHDTAYKIFNNSKEIGEIQIMSQWVLVKVTYLERMIIDIEKSLNDDRKVFDELEQKYEEFIYPFNVTAPQWFMYNPKFKKVELELSKQIDDLTVKAFGKEVEWPIALKISIHLYLIFSILVMMLRPDFVNVSKYIVNYCDNRLFLVFYFTTTRD